MERDNRTRTYRGNYRNKDGQTKEVTVKIFKGLATAALAIVLIKGIHAAIIHIGGGSGSGSGNNPEQPQEDFNIELINSILRQNPNMLKEIDIIDYTVGADTVSSIAARFGTSVKRIQELNNLKDPDRINFGQQIKVERVREINETDQEIKILETYLTDYLLSSKPAKIAKNENTNEPASKNLCRYIIFGNAAPGKIDPYSIYGRTMKAYDEYHNYNPNDPSLALNENQITEEERKQQYINELLGIVDDLLTNNDILGLVDYDLFKVYCKNGNTKSSEIVQEDVRAIIYG